MWAENMFETMTDAATHILIWYAWAWNLQIRMQAALESLLHNIKNERYRTLKYSFLPKRLIKTFKYSFYQSPSTTPVWIVQMSSWSVEIDPDKLNLADIWVKYGKGSDYQKIDIIIFNSVRRRLLCIALFVNLLQFVKTWRK